MRYPGAKPQGEPTLNVLFVYEQRKPSINSFTRYPPYAGIPLVMPINSIPSQLHPNTQLLFLSFFHLVLASRSLASLQLIQIPAADGQVALVLVHAGAEVADVLRADRRRLVLRVHRHGAVVRLSHGLVGRRGGRARAAAEPAAHGVADRGADCDTAGGRC